MTQRGVLNESPQQRWQDTLCLRHVVYPAGCVCVAGSPLLRDSRTGPTRKGTTCVGGGGVHGALSFLANLRGVQRTTGPATAAQAPPLGTVCREQAGAEALSHLAMKQVGAASSVSLGEGSVDPSMSLLWGWGQGETNMLLAAL